MHIHAYFNRLCFGYDSLPLAHAVHTLLFLELVGSWRLVEWLRGWLVGRLVGLLSGWLVDWMVWWLVVWSVGMFRCCPCWGGSIASPRATLATYPLYTDENVVREERCKDWLGTWNDTMTDNPPMHVVASWVGCKRRTKLWLNLRKIVHREAVKIQ